jgi:hypothetical protein
MTSTSPALSGRPSTTEQSGGSSTKSTRFDMDQFRQILAKRYMEWTELPDEVRIRHQYLQKHGLTESSLDTLSPADRAMHEEKIAELTDQPQLSLQTENDAPAVSVFRPVLTLQAVLEISKPDETASQTTEHPNIGTES